MDESPEKLTTGEQLSVEELLQCLPALKEVSPVLLKQYALGAAVRRRFAAGEIICDEGDFGSTAFYLLEGKVDIYINNPLAHLETKPQRSGFLSFMKRMTSTLVPDQPNLQEPASRSFIPIDASIDLPLTTPIASLGPGELIGEMTCRTFQPRSATVRATEPCVIVELLRVILDMLVGTRDVDPTTKATTKLKAPTFKGTSFKKQMDEQYRARSLDSHLRSVPLFGTLDAEFFNYLKERAELLSFSKGEVICKQGDDADAFYLIRTGLVRVSQKLPFPAGSQRTYLTDKTSGKQFWLAPDGTTVNDELVRTYLKRGEFFGEIGLLYDQARNATCSALDSVDLVKIPRDDFQLLLQNFPIVRATLDLIARARIETTKENRLPASLQLEEFIDQGLFQAQNLLLIDLDNCTRCDACVTACADAHDGVTRLIRDGLRYDRFLVATACRSCRDPLCMTQCPVGSIRRKESLEIIIEDWCIGCTKCAQLCPYGNINMHGFETIKDVPIVEKKPAAAVKPAAPPAAKAAPPAASPAAAAKPTPQPPAALEARSLSAAEQPSPTPPTPTQPPGKPATAAPAPDAGGGSPPGSIKPKETAAAKPAAASAPKKMERKKVTIQKATTCDLCTQLSVPSCVYACPHDAAKRVDPAEFLARQIGRKETSKQRFRWLGPTADRTTH